MKYKFLRFLLLIWALLITGMLLTSGFVALFPKPNLLSVLGFTTSLVGLSAVFGLLFFYGTELEWW